MEKDLSTNIPLIRLSFGYLCSNELTKAKVSFVLLRIIRMAVIDETRQVPTLSKYYLKLHALGKSGEGALILKYRYR